MNVAVIGANGQLGSDLVEVFSAENYDVFSLDHTDIKVEDINSVKTVLCSIKPHIVLNTAAFHETARCEKEPETAFGVNSIGPLNVSRIANDIGAISVFYSTDYVFDGNKRKPYVETDIPNPLNVYANSKLSGEISSLNYSDKSYVLRVSGIYGKVPCRAKGGNFVTTMIRLTSERDEVKVVTDEILTPTATSVIGEKTLELIKTDSFGLYHFTQSGACSWYEFAQALFETLKIKTSLLPTTSEDFPSPVKRPFYSVLENARLKEANISEFPHWKDSLITFLEQNYL